MKNLESTTEGVWIELLSVQLTTDQEALLLSQSEADRDAQQALMQQIKMQSETPAQAVDAALAQSKYLEVKPPLEEHDTYQLIAVNLSISENIIFGIINFRINGNHMQIRF